MDNPSVIISEAPQEPGWHLGIMGGNGTMLAQVTIPHDSDPYVYISKMREALDSRIIDIRNKPDENIGTNSKDSARAED